MMNNGFEVRPVNYRERIQFRCTCCGDCCRHIEESVMLESLDAYRLAKYLRQIDPYVKNIEDALAKYAAPILLTDNGFPVYVLKTWGEDDACIFLKENRCSVYPARPRTCRLYPLTAAPASNGQLCYFLCRDKPHHFVGDSIRVRDWVKEHFKREDQEFLIEEYARIPRLGQAMKQIKEDDLARAIVLVMFRRYYNYDLDAPFLPQFCRNMEALQHEMEQLIKQD